MPGGRPKGSGTKYDKKYCASLIAYFEKAAKAKARPLAPITTTNSEKLEKGKKGKGFLKQEVRSICAELPTIQGFAVSIKIPSSTVRGWAGNDVNGHPLHPEFAVAYARAKDIQWQILVDRGLTRQYDPQAFQFVAKNITEMTDKQVIAGDPENPIEAKLILVDAGAEPKSKGNYIHYSLDTCE